MQCHLTMNDTITKNENMNTATTIKLPPKPAYVCVDQNYGQIIGRDLRTGKPIREGKWQAASVLGVSGNSKN